MTTPDPADPSLPLLQAIAACSPDAIFAKDLGGLYLYVNATAAAALGRRPEEVRGRTDAELLPYAHAAARLTVDRQVTELGTPVSFEEELVTAQGRLVLHTIVGPMRDAAGRLVGVCGISRDLAWRRHRLDHPAGRVQAPLPAPAPASPAPAVLDDSVLPSLIGDEPEMLQQIRREYLESTQAVDGELAAALDAGDDATVAELTHRLKSSALTVGAMALGELCARMERAARAADPATVQGLRADLLSALATVRSLLQAGLDGPAEATSTAGPGSPPLPAVLIVDDDGFQRQMLGRQLALLDVGPVEAVGSGAQALGRLRGHDGSQMLLTMDLSMPGMDGIELMRRLAAQGFRGGLVLISAADERVLESGARLAAEHQLNVVCHLHKPVSPQALRDALLLWRGHMPTQQRRPSKMYGADELQRALAGDEFRVHYQPKVRLSDGGLAGVEALVRWQHPVDGLVYPDSFIHTAEQHDLVDQLTDVVLDLSLAQSVSWRRQGLAPRVAVNVSMDNLVRLDFPELVLARVAAHGLGTDSLTLEVTESRLMQDFRASLDILTRLRLNGIGLAIDDFGTGHSSLAQLRDLPFDELKIDRGFVHGSPRSTTQRAIVVASIEMAHQLGMRTVAEGVEDQSDWDAVHAAGCDIAQGWFIGKAMPGPQLVEWLAARGTPASAG